MTRHAVRVLLLSIVTSTWGMNTPATAQTVHVVPEGGNLQAAIDAAQPGDTITLAPGAVYVGNFSLPVKTGAAFITIRSAAADGDLPAADTRISPTWAPSLPKLQSPNSAPAMQTAPGAHHYRLLFLEFLANAQGAGAILALGDGSSKQNTLALVPHDLEVDRVYIHGDPLLGQKRAIALNSGATTITNSYVADIKAVGQDSQAIGGWNGPGPYVITNNYLEAAGENVMFGGADPAIAGLVPSDITFRGNYLSKPLSWRGSAWSIKNLFELKSAQRVLIDRNVFENNWAAAQSGYAILLKSVNQDGNAPWSVVQDVEFTNNIVRNVSSAINILGRDTRYPAVEANNIRFRNNVFSHISGADFGGAGRLLLINGGSHIAFDHNTAIGDGSSTVFADGSAVTDFVFTNNVLLDNGTAIKGSGTGEGLPTLAAFFPASVVTGNIIVEGNGSAYPAGNYAPGLATVGFTNFAGGDYRLLETSPFALAATDGTAPGTDFDELNAQPPDDSDDDSDDSGDDGDDSGDGGDDSGDDDSDGDGDHNGDDDGDGTGDGGHDDDSDRGGGGDGDGGGSGSGAGAGGGGGPAGAPATGPGAAGAHTSENTHTPYGLLVNVVGRFVSVRWNRPSIPEVLSYVLEAGTIPGASNAARVTTAEPALDASDVPAGRYYVRVRAITPAGIGEASAEATFLVGSATDCTAAPLPPAAPSAAVLGHTVTLMWHAPGACAATQYMVVAGSAPGLGDLAQVTVNGAALAATAPPGTYYVRVYALNRFGASAPSNEIVVSVHP